MPAVVKWSPSVIEMGEPPPINVVYQVSSREGKVKKVLRGLPGRNPDAFLWRVYKVLVDNPPVTALEIVAKLKLQPNEINCDRVAKAIRDLRRQKNGNMDIQLRGNLYKLSW